MLYIYSILQTCGKKGSLVPFYLLTSFKGIIHIIAKGKTKLSFSFYAYTTEISIHAENKGIDESL